MSVNKLWQTRGIQCLYLWAYTNLFLYIVYAVSVLMGWATKWEGESIWFIIFGCFFLPSLPIFALWARNEFDWVTLEQGGHVGLFSRAIWVLLGALASAGNTYIYWRDTLPLFK